MIENSIKQFRFMRTQQRDRLGTQSKTTERLGLAQRKIAATSYETKKGVKELSKGLEDAYTPLTKINDWSEALEALNSEESTTHALYEARTLDPNRPVARDDFMTRLALSESGGNYDAANREGYVGLLQFGQARLDDYNKVHGTSVTLDDFRADSVLQDRINVWHLADIDRAIASMDTSGFNKDGLRAVAHLGGIGGMRRYVSTDGRYNPEDSNGTSLRDYYNRFSH